MVQVSESDGTNRTPGDELADGALDAGLRAAFAENSAFENRSPGVLKSLEETAGIHSRVLLRDDSDEQGPVVKPAAQIQSRDARYQIMGEIARGGVGVVMKSRDTDLGRDVAMKVLRSEHASSSDMVRRFIEEAQIGGQLQHPGIVPVYELGLMADERPYFTMKLVKGEDLKAVFKRVHEGEPGWSVTRVLGLIQRACEAMAYAHAKQVIHRDLKPANIMVGNFGEVYVMDWGLARVLSQPDGRDIRLRPESVSAITELHSERHEAEAHRGSPLLTMCVSIFGHSSMRNIS